MRLVRIHKHFRKNHKKENFRKIVVSLLNCELSFIEKLI